MSQPSNQLGRSNSTTHSKAHTYAGRIIRAALLFCLLFAPISHAADSGLLDSLSAKLGFSSATNSFMSPEQAFVVSSEVVDSQHIVVRWEIADNYYLYREKFSFTLNNAQQDVTLASPRSPSGKIKHDEYFGDMEVYYHQAEITVPVNRDKVSGPINLDITAHYQGCADAGFCYPPQTSLISLRLPSQTSPIAGSGMVSEQQQYAHRLSDDTLLWALLSFFGIGLLLSFTPCVLPMYPILSGILMSSDNGQPTTARHGFMISLAYVLPMALTYAMAGIIASLFGQNLQIIFQDPWIIGLFSIVFVLLALAMFGFYNLQLPSHWQSKLNNISNNQRRGSYIGAAIMGFLSALIVGPCVAAPLAGILIYISTTGDAALGGLALFVTGMGMGAPLLLLGASAGKLLPKAGAWMNTIKQLFGVLLLGLAIWMLERVIPASLALFLWAALLIGTAIFLGALDRLQPEATRWQKLWKASGLIMLIYGSLLIIGAASGAKNIFLPLEKLTLTTTSNATAAHTGSQQAHSSTLFQQFKGLDGLQAAIQSANGRPVMVDFYADWCVECKRMENNTFNDPQVSQLLSSALLLQADVTANDAQDQALLKQYGLYGPPGILFFNRQGIEQPNYRLIGYMDPENFSRHLQRAFSVSESPVQTGSPL